MKREYFLMLFMTILLIVYFACNYFFGSDIVEDKISKFLVIIILISFYAGQYSTKFPKL